MHSEKVPSKLSQEVRLLTYSVGTRFESRAQSCPESGFVQFLQASSDHVRFLSRSLFCVFCCCQLTRHMWPLVTDSVVKNLKIDLCPANVENMVSC